MKARQEARKAVRDNKDRWFSTKADKAQEGRLGGKIVWRSICDMQHACRGLRPRRVGNIKDEEGRPCTSTEEKQQRWKRHFANLLNIESHYSVAELDKIRQRPMRPQPADLPTLDELMDAVGKMKNKKAGGSSGILPEMVKVACRDPDFEELLLHLVHTTWKEGSVPKDWTDAVIVPIPKKGDLSNCDNWRGISLLDVVGKVTARILQDRLQQLAKEELPDSQCSFRRGRDCSDMIFAVRQLVEKSWEHRARTFFLFIDLCKAYDTVPRQLMWQALAKLGVPQSTIQLIQSFHQDMQATIQLDGTGAMQQPYLNPFSTEMGSVVAPSNLYACLFMEHWTERVRDVEGMGVDLKHKQDHKLFRRYTRNADVAKITEFQFADDTALLAITRAGAEKALRQYMKVAEDFGLTVSTSKTKLMVAGREVTADDKAPIQVRDGQIESVTEFSYLGSVIASSGRVQPDIDRRIAQASKAFGTLRKPVFNNRDLKLKTKRKVYQACVLSVLLYGSECWTPLRKDLKKLDSFRHRCICSTLGISNRQQWAQHITSQSIRQRWGDREMVHEKISKRRLEWLGHLAQMSESWIPKICPFGWLPHPRPQGGPRRRWKDVIRTDLKALKIPEVAWYEKATTSRAGWRTTYRQACAETVTTEQQHKEQAPHQVQCPECQRTFRRESDMKRHKCLEERRKPVSEQLGAVRCPTCERWFHSSGGFAVHTCRPGSQQQTNL